tara:strand:+ start:382 stop:738 length:357 start_codon:yes stop_codon:yes gene_type:complete
MPRYKPLPGIAGGDRLKRGVQFKVKRKDLGEGVLGEAYPNKVVINKNVTVGSDQYKDVMKHEAQHVRDMQIGRAGFSEKYVKWEGKLYPRKNGTIKYKGKWIEEGDKSFPWEQAANKA